MISINVRREKHGWSVHIGESVTSPFWSSDLAIREANALADAIRRHGACVDVVVEEDVRGSQPAPSRRQVTADDRPAPHGQIRIRQQKRGDMKAVV